ncbi:MAG: hypothetical protein ACI4AH_04140 [Muribaculaceae bacterium]
MRKVIFIIVAVFSMSIFSSCDEPEFTTSDSETVINSDKNHTYNDNEEEVKTGTPVQDKG